MRDTSEEVQMLTGCGGGEVSPFLCRTRLREPVPGRASLAGSDHHGVGKQ